MSGVYSTLIRKRLEFSRNQRMSRSELEALQIQKFRQLVQYAQQHSPYYQRLISDRSIDIKTCIPADFPVLTKPTLIEHFDDIVTDRRINKRVISDFLSRSSDPHELLFNEFRVLHTSGSSGQIGHFVFSKADWSRGIIQLPRQLKNSSSKLTLRRKRIAYFGAVGGHFGGVSMIIMSDRGIFKLLFRLSLNEVNDPLSKVIARLNEFQPDILSGYTTALKILAEKQLSGELNISPHTVTTGGEAQSTGDRDLFIRAFNCKVGNGYGCTEHLMVGSSRKDNETMVLYDDDLIFEFYSDHSVITNLFNFTLPLIRYHMSDIFLPVENDSSADPYLLIHSIVGRTEMAPTFVNRDGVDDFISAFTIIELFIPGVSRFQMRLLGKDHFDFAICLDSELDSELDDNARKEAIAATEKRLREVLAQKLMENVRFNVVVENDLPINESTGKYELIVDLTPASIGSTA